MRSPLADEKALDFYGIGLMSHYLWVGMTGQVNNSGIYLPIGPVLQPRVVSTILREDTQSKHVEEVA